MSMSKNVSPAKIEAVKELKEMCESHDVIGFVKMAKIGAKQVMNLRSKLRGLATLRMAKKTLIARAFENVSGKPGLDKLLDAYNDTVGPSAMIFSNENALKLRMMLDDSKTATRARQGDVVEREIIIPAGNTNIPPGPVISELNQVGLPTRIQDGTIWIQKDTTILKPGDEVDSNMAMVLARLDIEPIDVVLDLYIAYENGEIMGKEILTLDLEVIKEDVMAAYATAMKLSIELGIVTPDNARHILTRAFMNARVLALELPIIIPEFLEHYLRKAQAQASILNAKVTGEPLPPQPGTTDSKPEETPPEADKEEEDQEEEEDVGLDDLFG
ncbi:50S ribosomal protein L10 [Candidatus Bathyarchaeota archaeon]|nr:50S ribosomal protein L10 [Candidatus Bathyarchaeota archaeon]